MNRYNKYLTMNDTQHKKTHESAFRGDFDHYPFTQGADFFRYMFKYFVDTFKPYKASYQRNRDFLQVFYGLANVLLGSIMLTSAVVYSLLALSFLMFQKAKGDLNGSVLANYFFKLKIIILKIVGILLRGVTQIATAPLAWLRIPLRLAITHFKGAPLIENNQGLHKLAVLASQEGHAEYTYAVIRRALLHKCMKAISQGQKTQVDAIVNCKESLYVNYHHFLQPYGASVAPAAGNAVESAPAVRNNI